MREQLRKFTILVTMTAVALVMMSRLEVLADENFTSRI